MCIRDRENPKHGKDAKQLPKVVNRRLAFLKRRGQIFSITTDNGTEFTHFKSIERALILRPLSCVEEVIDLEC